MARKKQDDNAEPGADDQGEFAAAADLGERDLDEDDRVLTVAELARGIAAGGRVFANGGQAVHYEEVFDREEALIMADFVRDNPDAPAEAMFIHLSLVKRYPRTVPNTVDTFVLSLFHHACKAANQFAVQQAAEERARRWAEKPAAGGWPGEQALQPQPPALSPTGFSPR